MLSSSAVTPHLLAAGVPSPAPGVPFPAPGVPSPTPTADSRAAEPLQHPPVTPACTLSARKVSEKSSHTATLPHCQCVVIKDVTCIERCESW